MRPPHIPHPTPTRPSAPRRAAGRGAILAAMALAVFVFWEGLLLIGPSTILRRFIDKAELSLYDGHVAALPVRKPDSRIVVVGMDDETLEKLPGLERPYYPLPRTYHAHLVDQLRRAGAKVVGFDIMFSLDRPEEDGVFARALRQQGNVVVALTPTVALENGAETASFAPPADALRPVVHAASILLPSDRVRWFDPLRADDALPGVRFPHFGVALVAAFHDEYAAVPDLRDTFHWGSHIDAPTATISDREQVLLRYAGPGGTYDPIPYWQVYSGDWQAHHPGFFRGKIVLVGRISALEDQHDTPRGQMPGVEILANIAGMTLNHDYLRAASPQTALAIGAVLMTAYLLVLWRWTLVPAAVAAAVLSLVWAALPRLLLRTEGVWIETFSPLLCLASLLALSTVYETARMRGQFERFVPSWVARRVLTGSGRSGSSLAPGGAATAERPVTVVFCDIRRFTEIAEQHPDHAAEILRRFFDAGDRAARRQGTELDKYIGDEIMLYFFERRGWEAHPLRAVRWAGEMLRAVAEIDASGLAGNIGFRVGIGIATGTAREGFVGTRKRLQSTVIGDVVNVASRLQEATKTLNRPVVMNEATFSHLAGMFSAEPLAR